MRTESSSRGTARLLAVLTVLVGLPGVASAQQSGLFPLRPIKRERVPCSMEDPIYKLYRSQYYGYYPTQWRPFPQGWNLPSPEGPNTREALAKQPIEASAPMQDEGPDEEAPAAPDRGQRPAPTPPPENERSPFELDRPENAAGAPGAGPAPRRPAPGGNAPAPPAGAERSPFEMPDDAATPDQPAGPRPRAPQPSRPAPDVPDLGPPGSAPTPPPRTSREDREDRHSAPMLAMPDASLPTIEEADSMSSAPAPAATAPPAMTPAPARRNLFGGLFAGRNLNFFRR
jgi:hypothetical protein